jgi:predicted small metal-binding protein
MKTMTCPCGQEVSGETDEEFVEKITAHIESAHPELAGKYTPEQMLSRAREV